MENEMRKTLPVVCAESLETLDRDAMDKVIGGATGATTNDVPGVNGWMTADKVVCDHVHANDVAWFKQKAEWHNQIQPKNQVTPEALQDAAINYCREIGL